jgi:hypothetical protein
LRELEEKECKRSEHQHRCRHAGQRGRPGDSPALDRKSRVEALAKIR